MQTTLTVEGSAVSIEYKLAPKLVVCSHGFGVRRDARGLFTDIVAGLPEGWGYVLFDYDAFDEVTGRVIVNGFTSRVARLRAVLDWARRQTDVEQLNIVGHSMGALTVADVAPEDIGAIVLLAPPLSLGLRFAELYTKRPGAKHSGHSWTIPRSDDTTTVVDDDLFAELINIDAEAELAKLAFFRPYTMVLASSDEILQDEDYTDLIVMPTVSMISIEQASHDFAGQARAELVTVVIAQLLKGISIKDTSSLE